MISFLGRLSRSAKQNAMTGLLARHRAVVAADIAEAIAEAVPGHSRGNECDGMQLCNTCARRRQAVADAELALRIGEAPVTPRARKNPASKIPAREEVP